MDAVVNSEKLKTLVERAGGTTVVAYEADVGLSTLVKLMAGTYPSPPRRKLRDRLCSYFKIKEADLFPLDTSKQKKQPERAKEKRPA